jgi:hypothetical protein
MHRPFPTIVEARTHLLLKEIDIDARPPSPPSALVATMPAPPAATHARQGVSTPAALARNGQPGGQRNGHRRGKGGHGQ